MLLEFNVSLMKTLDYLFVFAIFIILVGISEQDKEQIKNEIRKQQPNDYSIEFDSCGKVEIKDKHGYLNIIHIDSLEEFIIKDNL